MDNIDNLEAKTIVDMQPIDNKTLPKNSHYTSDSNVLSRIEVIIKNTILTHSTFRGASGIDYIENDVFQALAIHIETFDKEEIQ